MASPALVHVIGTVALITILVTIIHFTSSVTTITMYYNDKNMLETIAESIYLQLKYALKTKTNLSIILDYPIEISSGKEYNLVFGYASAINNTYHIFSNTTNPFSIYVLAITLDGSVYGYHKICDPVVDGSNISFIGSYRVFGSRLIVKTELVFSGNIIYINMSSVGVKRP